MEELERLYPHERVKVAKTAYNGLELMWRADLVVSAGGTMNREAALMGVPTYSILTAPLGEADRALVGKGRMQHINSLEKVEEIEFVKRQDISFSRPDATVLDYFLDVLETGLR